MFENVNQPLCPLNVIAASLLMLKIFLLKISVDVEKVAIFVSIVGSRGIIEVELSTALMTALLLPEVGLASSFELPLRGWLELQRFQTELCCRLNGI